MKHWITGSGTRITRIIGGRSNAFLITGKGVHLLVDTGPGFMKRRLENNLNREQNAGLDFLVLTHTHFDHAANAGMIKSAFNPRVIAHAAEAQFLESGDSPLPAGTNFLTSWLVRTFEKKVTGLVRFPGVTPDLMIDKATDLSDSGINVAILPTPGHTAGSLSVIIDQELALVGDTLFGVIPGRCFPPFADNVDELINSWQLLLNTGCRLFLPSHGRSRSREELQTNLGIRLQQIIR
ncbi:MAG: MBL fold metallo-hydrolase [Bacteroidota bacterium]